MVKKRDPISGVGAIAFLAIFILFILFLTTTQQTETKIKITGATVTSTTVDVLKITVSDTSGTISWKNLDGTQVSLPIAGDGTATAGASETEAILFASDAKNNPEQRVYLEGETCQGTNSVTDCVNAQFLVVQNKEAHLFRIGEIDTEKNEINIKDITYEKESNNNVYTDSLSTRVTVGDIPITLTLTEATKVITFTIIGSTNGADIELYDKATLEIINTDTALQTFEGMRFREYNDGALPSEKYIGAGGTDPLTIEIIYDDTIDASIEIKSIINTLTKAHGSGWYTTEALASFYTNKGTLITYDNEEKHLLKIQHVATTTAATMSLKKTTDQASDWVIYGVDREGNVGKASALTLDQTGFAHMSYFDETNDALKYAYETAEGWYVQVVDAGNVGRASDIALDSDEKPHIIYTDNENDRLKYAFYDGTHWRRWTIEAAGATAILPTLALTADDAQYIAYYDYSTHDLMLLYYDQIKAEWHQQIIDEEGDVGGEAAIAMDTKNNPHVVYLDNTYDFLKYAWYDGTAWQHVILDGSGAAGLFTAITLDENNYPTVWYYNQLKDKVLYLHYVGNNKWQQKTFDLEGFDIWQGDVILDSNGYVHFSYYSEEEQDLRYAVGLWE